MARIKTYLLNYNYTNIILRVLIENETYTHKKTKIDELETNVSITNLSAQITNISKQLQTITRAITSPF